MSGRRMGTYPWVLEVTAGAIAPSRLTWGGRASVAAAAVLAGGGHGHDAAPRPGMKLVGDHDPVA